jgi:hypothetical protein
VAHEPVEIVAVLPTECHHGGRGGREKALLGDLGDDAMKLEDFSTESSTPCTALSCSSIVRLGVCVVLGIAHHTLPLVSPEVKSDVRQGEGWAIGE